AHGRTLWPLPWSAPPAARTARLDPSSARPEAGSRHSPGGSRRRAPPDSQRRAEPPPRGSSASRELLAPLLLRQRVDESIEVALEDRRKIVHGHVHPVVRDSVLGEVVGPDLLRALAGPDLSFPSRRLLPLLLVLCQLQQAGPEVAQGLLLVLPLGPLLLDGDHDPRRLVRDPNGGVGGVH